MDEKKPDNETVVRQDAPGEDWLNGRGAFCGRCGGKDNKPTVAWDASEGCVRCSECVYINPDATRETVLYLLEQRDADEKALALSEGFVTEFENSNAEKWAALDAIAKAVGYVETANENTDDALPAFVRAEFARAKEEGRKSLSDEIRLNVGFGDDPKETVQERIAGLMDEHMGRESELQHVTKRFGDLVKAIGFPEDAEKTGFEAVVDFARALKSDLETADKVIEDNHTTIAKLEADLKEARAKPKTAKAEGKKE